MMGHLGLRQVIALTIAGMGEGAATSASEGLASLLEEHVEEPDGEAKRRRLRAG